MRAGILDRKEQDEGADHQQNGMLIRKGRAHPIDRGNGRNPEGGGEQAVGLGHEATTAQGRRLIPVGIHAVRKLIGLLIIVHRVTPEKYRSLHVVGIW